MLFLFPSAYSVPPCFKGFGFAFPITAITLRSRAITAIPEGCRGISTVLLKANDFSQIDPCVTPRFPLGHPDFSTGSPKVLLGSRKHRQCFLISRGSASAVQRFG